MSTITIEELRASRILVVDDLEANTRLLTRILTQAGYHSVNATSDARNTAALLTSFAPDLILLDLHMPEKNGIEVLREIGELIPRGSYLPILILTGDLTSEAREQALAAGARDFVTKPFDRAEILLRIGNLLETRHLHLRLVTHNTSLEQLVQERTSELRLAQAALLETLARAGEFRDDDTSQHTERVGWMSQRLAEIAGFPAARAQTIGSAARMHDIGKIGIPDPILLKDGPLNAAEWDIMKRHTTIGEAILQGDAEIMKIAARIARTHHERWDGTGYPEGLIQDAIPAEGRIVSIVDVFDALTHDRPYRKAFCQDDAISEMTKSLSQFDPALLKLFLASLPEFTNQVNSRHS